MGDMTKNIYLHSYFSRMLFGFFAGIFCVCSTFAQLPRAIYDDINGITLLQTDRQTVKNLLSPGSFMVSEAPNSDEFYRENYTVDIEYSSGECRDTENIGDRTFLGSDVWKVGLGKVVKIEIEPKASFLLSELGLDISKFNKERLYRGRKFYNIYFNKSFGMAISVGGDKVQSIIWFPRKQDHGFLCNNDRIRRYYSSNKWRIRRGPKLICVLMNLPPNITDILLNPTNGDAREFEVTVKCNGVTAVSLS